MATKKYKILKNKSIIHNMRTLYRIKALKDFNTVDGRSVNKGEFGGYVESENNLSQEGTCWIFGNAKVYDNAVICDDALISGSAVVSQRAKVFNKAIVYGNAKIHGNAKICGKVQIYGNAEVYGNAYVCGDALVNGIAKISGNKKIEAGEYIVKSFNVDEALDEIKPICDKIDFVSKAMNSNFPVEEHYAKSLISQFAEYNKLADFFEGHIYFLYPKENEIFTMLSQCKKDVEILKKIK